ncbi:MAG TPA: TonB-dependent receptor [Terriglobia bacterium]|nr:TonB-dependent receptor [Terriglobia bacterium]
MRVLAITAVALISLSVSTGAFAQSTVGRLNGVVTDNTKAALPGVSVKVLNADTGIGQSTLTNDGGRYSFILAPGSNYTVTAEFPNFKKVTINKITLRMADEARVDIVLEVGDVVNTVVVDASQTDPLLKQPTIGVTLDETEIANLPLVGNDPLALITTLPGYRASPLGHQYDTVGGLPMYMMNTTRDGLSVTDGFSPNGVGSTTILNPDMISEIRLILSPVDAESGRGNGQVQITTKSGTNRFQWNINYNLRQNALNALGPSTTRFKQPFGATFQYIVSVGGPIWKNHTFYFVNWDHQMRWQRSGATPIFAGAGFSGYGGYLSVPALTDPARNGIFRYFDGWSSLPSDYGRPTANNTNGTGQWPVDIFTLPNGQDIPVAPQYFSDDITLPYTGTLRCYSVFGNIKFDGTPFDPATDCGQYIPRVDDGLGNGVASWLPDYNNPVYGVGVAPDPSNHVTIVDPSAPGGVRVSWDQAGRLIDRPPDRTGYIQRLLAKMPRVNNYTSSFNLGGQVQGFFVSGTTGSDGLNRAASSWVRSTSGQDNQNTFRGGTFGIGTSLDQSLVNHKIINLKIDHNIGNHSRVSVSTSFQNDQNSRLYFQSRWPEGADGYAGRTPRILTVNGISTITPNLVNEARFGVNYNRSTQLAPWENPDQARADYARSWLQDGWLDPNNGEVSPVYFLPGSQTAYYNFQDNVLPYGISGANNGLQANVGTTNNGVQGNPVSSGCTSAGNGASFLNGSLYSSVNCEAGSALYNFADTISWNHGAHAIRSGIELRLTRARELSGQIIPQARGGVSSTTTSDLAQGGVVPELPGFSTVDHLGRQNVVQNASADLLYFLSGSVASVNQTFWVNSIQNYTDGTWDTWSTGEGVRARRTFQNEYAFFVKDDWKITKRLTLNLGVRYENYGNLYLNGFNTGILDGGYGLFGPARSGHDPNQNPFDYWLAPGNHYYTGYGKTPPSIDVTGTFLPNGQPNYIPGNCLLATATPGAATSANDGNGNSGSLSPCINPGGPGIQFVPSSQTIPGVVGTNCNNVANQASICNFTTVVACVWGVQQPSLNNLLPVSNCDPSTLTTRSFVGPGSNHPELDPYYRDNNNIGPAIGFSYRVPLGSRTLLIRGGFQFTFGSAGRDRSVGTGSAGQLSAVNGGGNSLDQITRTCTAASQCLDPNRYPGVSLADADYAMTIADLPNLIPLQTQLYNDPNYYRPAVSASGTSAGGFFGSNSSTGITTGDQTGVQFFGVQRTLSATAFARGYQDPRTENYTFSVSTNLSRTSSLSLSYVGTLGRNRPTSINLNMPNVYYNPELVDALNVTRAGGYAPLFDKMFAGWNMTGMAASAGWGPVGSCVSTAGNPDYPGGAPAYSESGVDAFGNDYNINCPANTIYQSGSAHLRNAQVGTYGQVAQLLANGNFYAVANTLAANSPTSGGNTTTPANNTATGNRSLAFGATLGGNLLRNGCDRAAQATTTARFDLVSGSPTQGNTAFVRCFPEDYLIINPTLTTGNSQVFGISTGGSNTGGQGVVYKDTWGYTNYHQFQAQYTLRLNSGVSFQATYLTSKTLALPRDFYRTNTFNNNALGGTAFGSVTGFTDPKNEETRKRDYGESSDSLKHAVRVNGVFPLPFGPGQPLLSSAPGWLTRIVGGWQMGVIYNVQSGQPMSIYAGETMFGSSAAVASGCDSYSGTFGISGSNCASSLVFPDVVSTMWTNPQGHFEKNGENGDLTYFGNPSPFAVIPDPQCTSGTVGLNPDRPSGAALTGQCYLKALVMKVPAGTPGAFALSDTDPTPVLIMLQNPMPGHQGSLGGGTMKQPGRFYLDANLVKTFMFSERRGIQIRVDATNVLNHPTPSDLYLSLGPSTDSPDAIIDKFNTSNAGTSALATGCFAGNTACGRQIQFGIRMIN